jgi:hypothetical protein
VRKYSIPKTSSGKIQRHACRESFLNDGLELIAKWCSWEEERQPPASPPYARHKAVEAALTNGDHLGDVNQGVAQIVMEQVRAVAKERAKVTCQATAASSRSG